MRLAVMPKVTSPCKCRVDKRINNLKYTIMNIKLTKAAVMYNFSQIISLDCSELQNELNFMSEKYIGHTEGVYGWNADVYDFGCGRSIVTGDRPFGKRANTEIVKNIHTKYLKIMNNKRWKRETKINKVNELLLTLFDN